jgi:ferredoxin-thioredoxin reductase catalytic subunit
MIHYAAKEHSPGEENEREGWDSKPARDAQSNPATRQTIVCDCVVRREEALRS